MRRHRPAPGAAEAWGLPTTADGLARFADICVAAFGRRRAVVKPQSAFFEVLRLGRHRRAGTTVAAARAGGALVLLDVKRGDIGTTMAAYAAAYLDPAAPLAADAITASPYLGVGSLHRPSTPCPQHGGGVFVLALTSNPEGPQVQHARTEDGRLVAQVVIDELGRAQRRRRPVGSLGVVVGATIGAVDIDLTTQRAVARARRRGPGRHGRTMCGASSAGHRVTSCRASRGRCSGTVRRSRPACGGEPLIDRSPSCVRS